jgi:hypothetical protein
MDSKNGGRSGLAFFVPNTKYRVNRDFKGLLCNFERGSVVTFLHAGYSRYDEFYHFDFSTSDGRELSLAVGTDEVFDWAACFSAGGDP